MSQLFKNHSAVRSENVESGLKEPGSFFPQNETNYRSDSTVVDIALTEKAGRNVLINMKAMEHTMSLLLNQQGRIDSERIQEIYNTIHHLIKNGPTKNLDQRLIR